MQDWLMPVATTAIAVLAYLIRRGVEKVAVNERLARRIKVVELYRSLRRANLKADELDGIERELLASGHPQPPAATQDNRGQRANPAK